MLISLAFIFCSCGGGNQMIEVGDIDGPGSLDERAVADFSISANEPGGVAYEWAVDPSSAGSFTNGQHSVATFHANEVTCDTDAVIRVTISGQYSDPVVVSRDVTIIDTNQMPRAAAHTDKSEIGAGQSVRFYNDSTDPEGDDDIVSYEWDFSYDDDDGFCCECNDCEPSRQFDEPGTYAVQLRVTDRSDIIDMLNTPIVIDVVQNSAPVITAVHHSRTTSETGNYDEGVELWVEFDDSLPVDDTHSFKWVCDHGSFNDSESPVPVWYPTDYVVECVISVRVTDRYGLADEAGCHQWVTEFPVLVNPDAPGNTVPSANLPSVYGGTVDPAGYAHPGYPGDGQVVLLSYWATYSGASVDGIAGLVDIYHTYCADDYVQVLINEGDSMYNVLGFIEDNLYESTYWLLDSESAYFNLTRGWNGNSNTLPQHLLIDRDGYCRWADVGQLTWMIDLQLALEELL